MIQFRQIACSNDTGRQSKNGNAQERRKNGNCFANIRHRIKIAVTNGHQSDGSPINRIEEIFESLRFHLEKNDRRNENIPNCHITNR